jgi:hypothetical protein
MRQGVPRRRRRATARWWAGMWRRLGELRMRLVEAEREGMGGPPQQQEVVGACMPAG